MSGPAIIAKDITVRYRPLTQRSFKARRRRESHPVIALDEVSITVEQGEAMGVIGQNGAGKSTLLRVLGGTLKPNSGLVEYRVGPPTLLELGVGFNLALSGRSNIMLGGLASGHRKAKMESLFDEIVEFAGLEDAIDRPVSTYSSGMRSRLAFSIAMTLQPETLLIDELLTVGDAAFRAKSADVMDGLLQRTGTIVMVSHSMASVKETCDRALWLDRGRVQMVGDVHTVVDAYLESIGEKREQQEDSLADIPREQWTARERSDVVRRVMRGASIEQMARATGVTAEEIHMWRRKFLQGGYQALRASNLQEDD